MDMQKKSSSLDIINCVLGEEGLLRYTAMKNRFICENTEPQQRNFLHIYSDVPTEIENSAIDQYRVNLQKLRRKIEERVTRVTEVLPTPGTCEEPVITHSETTIINKEECAIVEALPEQQNTPKPNGASIYPPYSISSVASLELFKISTITGEVKFYHDKKYYTAHICIQGSLFSTTAYNTKGEEVFFSRVDLSLSHLYVVANAQSKSFFCFKQPVKRIPIEKETEIVNVTKIKTGHSIILKNTNTENFTKEIVKNLTFCLIDPYDQMYKYRVEDTNDFIKWIVIMKIRMHAVDLWNRNDLIESIRK
ncbi:hypothetical protein NEFER03_2041 [Nematocida sp. LUAm3]|nr:hypothetical protein NEFER03_2041 [Nematocida sp. LUAm3]KAI5174515.1 hypothetical protein NEFER02_0636 [Nematocida sp. LUAm2]KAI5179166.1 hypothetical protein NEFER01_2029 [Nematocida sp. LUAm1]